MAIIVNTNLSALKTQDNLNNASTNLTKSLERLSTGLKINSAKDDAAGMFVATGLSSQIRGSQVAKGNIATGNNVLNMVEGDFDVIMENLNRIRDLAVQASNSVFDTASLKSMKDEVELRLKEIDRIATASNFNGMQLLCGTAGTPGTLSTNGLRLQVGAGSNAAANSIVVDAKIFAQVSSTLLGSSSVANDSGAIGIVPATGSGITDGSLSANVPTAFGSSSAAAAFITVVDNAINTIAARKAKIGTTMSRLESADISLQTVIENNTAAKSTIMDADIAAESANYTKHQILQQTSATLLIQANALPSLALSLLAG